MGRYRLIAPIGRGGMADVYLAAAEGPGGFSKLLVVKELSRRLAEDVDFLSMFLNEARLAARLSHPNVVQTYEVGNDGGRYFIAMEYLNGQSLQRVLHDGLVRLPVPARLRLLAEALRGLHYAHELTDYDGRPLAVVHRDVTPHNVFVTYEGEVKLVDFGIAKAANSWTETRVGTLKGKVGYMAPEQARGELVDRRADLYSAGVILWEILARRRMWQGLPELTILTRLATGQIPRLDAVRPDLPTELLQICARATAARREDRYLDAAEFQRDLERVSGRSPEALPCREIGRALAQAYASERRRIQSLIEEQLQRWPPDRSASFEGGFGTHAALQPAQSSSVREASCSSMSTPAGVVSVPRDPVEGTSPSRRRSGSGTRTWSAAALIGVGVVAAGAWTLLRQHPPEPTPSASAAPLLAAAPPTRAPSNPCEAPNKPLVELTGDLENDARLSCDKDYLLRFTVFVRPGATLTIDSGTTIRGDRATKGTLVVQPGARIIAEGTRERPIVFTSHAPAAEQRAGDWGGLIVLGSAPINLLGADGKPARGRVEGLTSGGEYGGNDPSDDSGVLRYVRIEYSGTELAPNNEINGLTLAGVGSKTSVDFVQVRKSADDCFEFFGGTVNAKHLICQHPGDDGFDWDYGYQGKLQFLVFQDDPQQDNDGNGFEGDNDPSGTSNAPISNPTIYNATLCGKNRKLTKQHYGMLLRHGTRGQIRSTIVTGFAAGLDVRDASTAPDLRANLFFGNLEHELAFPELGGGAQTLADDDGGFDEVRWLLEPARGTLRHSPELGACFDAVAPEFRPSVSLTQGAAKPPNDGFFDTSAQFLGAFRDREDRWDEGGWAVWSER